MKLCSRDNCYTTMITARIPAFFKRLFYADAICYLDSLILQIVRIVLFFRVIK